MTVAEYEQKFIQLSRHALALVENEEDKYRQFEDGLREKIHSIVTVVYHTLFGVLFQAAMRVERSITEGRSPVERSRPFDCVGNSSQGPMNRSGYESRSFSSSRPIGFIYAASSTSRGSRQSQSFAQPSDSSSTRFTTLRTKMMDRSGRTQNPQFTSCDRYHTEPYQFGGSGYFCCGQPSHIKRDCPLMMQRDTTTMPQDQSGGALGGGQRMTEVDVTSSSGAQSGVASRGI
ncbi:hypothetical protein M0R45_006690 [Rubus argutus]|uniref:Uncharacterized protein n=1 Tax=Rubus argutus TaxID=59490 RepID=A0AAW1YRQ7_RUBAR